MHDFSVSHQITSFAFSKWRVMESVSVAVWNLQVTSILKTINAFIQCCVHPFHFIEISK